MAVVWRYFFMYSRNISKNVPKASIKEKPSKTVIHITPSLQSGSNTPCTDRRYNL